MLLKIVAGLVMLSVLVIIHELGHFVVARLFGIGTPVFAIGMGPRVAGFRLGETDFRIAAFPIGGYVQMSGADPFGEEDPDSWIDPDKDFMRKPVWQRLLVMAAGPAANLLLPVVLLAAVLMGGEERPDAVVGMVLPDSPAELAGIQPGDRVLAVGDHPIEVWGDLVDGLGAVRGEVEIKVLRAGAEQRLVLPAAEVSRTEDGYADLRSAGLSWMQVSSQVGVDDPASPAARAGLRTGDGIVAVDGVAVRTWEQLSDALAGGAAHEVTYRRQKRDEADTASGAADEASRPFEEGTVTLAADPTWAPRAGDPHGDRFGLIPVQLFVGAYAKDSAASEAGVKLDDRIFAIDGVQVRDWNDLLRLVAATAPPPEQIARSGGCLGARQETPELREVTLTVVRDGALIDLSFRPRLTRELVRAFIRYRPLLGIQQYPDAFVEGGLTFRRVSLLRAVPEAVRDTVGVVGSTFGVLGQFLAQERKASETIGGPIAIFDMAGQSAALGFAAFGRMMAAISVGLAIVNLLPVPVLDGGQILFYAIEGLRGRPLSLALRERIQMVGVLFLIGLFLFVSVNDISRVIRGG